MRLARLSVDLTPGLLVVLLGITQIIGYGTVYYSFAILAGDIAASFSWPVSSLFGAFSLALLVGGFAAPAVGRMVDRHGAARVMTVGSAATAVGLAAAAAAPGPIAFCAALIAIQTTSTLVLYDVAFAAIVQSAGPQARTRITHLTLIAGFASTLFWPLSSWLHTVSGWREVFLIFAALNLLVCLPLHAVIAFGRPSEPQGSPGDAVPPGRDAPVAVAPLSPAVARQLFVLVTVGFALSGFLLSAMLAQMVPALTTIGLGSTALVVSTLFGPAQVLVRFVNMILGARRHPLTVTIFGMAMLPLAILILAASAPSTAGAVAFAVLLGFGSGLKSIVQGTLPLALFGSASYGTRLGIMAFARQFMAAVAPFAFAWQMEVAGPTAALMTFAAVGCLGLSAFLELARRRARLEPAEATAVRPAE
ncbi:arsenite efflux MFS transporter ArsK [Chthonobacter albigriseus]|uniref:arsenite efflux MFS transporter ArsK n=1 Tax=Chthonobacter albigriseus TaxID=1683161 RepID=UPI00313FEFDD